jgi:pimeloyl-ACP methyl ester carboxylesterase
MKIKSFLYNFLPIKTLFVRYDNGGSDKKTIVLLHGVASTSKTWEYLISILDKEKFRLVAIDLLGFGESISPKNSDYTIGEHTRYIHKTIKKLHIKHPYTVVGHSMGSIIASHYATKYPKEISEVFLLSLPLYFTNKELHNAISYQQTNLFIKAYKFIIAKKRFTIKTADYLRKIFNIENGIEITDKNWKSFRLSLINTIINQDTYNDIRKIKVPVHVIYGTKDELLISSNLQQLNVFGHVDIQTSSSLRHAFGKKYAELVAKRLNQETGQ